MALVAGVDSSTQSCKVVIRDAATGALVRSGRAPHPDGTEVDPAAWWGALLSAFADAGGGFPRPAGELAGRPALVRVEDVDQVVRHPGALFRPRLGRADVESAIDLQGVGVDDLPRQLLGKRHGELALAGGRGADDGDDGRSCHWIAWRPARAAMVATSSAGSIGLARWAWNPAESARMRSSLRA